MGIVLDCEAVRGSADSVRAAEVFGRCEQALTQNLTEALASVLIHTRNVFKDLSSGDLEVYEEHARESEPSILARSMVSCNQPYVAELARISNRAVAEDALHSWLEQFL